ncbi:MAG: hydantoin racemase [Propionibacteriales bacterium]|nr:hydantoin racemase [Propionibacteriales bacterium]
MRLLGITPISVRAEELARRQARYDRLAPAGLSVRLENLGTGSEAPRALETADDVAASEAALLERYSTADLTGFDGLLPDCVLDPAVEHPSVLPLPTYGLGRLSAYFLAGFGVRVGAVARNRAIAAELDRKLTGYGLPLTQETAVLELSVDDIADDATWAHAVRRTAAELDVDALINACSAVEIEQAPGRTILLDPTATALRMISEFGSQAAV